MNKEKNKERFIISKEGIVLNPKLTKKEQEESDYLDTLLK